VGSPFRSVSLLAQPYSATGGELQYNLKTNEFVQVLQCEAQVLDYLLLGHMGYALTQIQDDILLEVLVCAIVWLLLV
jgi:hypothetical protein